MIYCKCCGIALNGRYYGDFDETQYHAWLYHLDLIDEYGWVKTRQIIEKGLEMIGEK